MKNVNTEIARITEELRDIYKNTNEGPKLIAEMVEREFPYPRKVLNKSGEYGMLTTQSPS
jgi:uncharacterized hydantoinase/oxoprolinase family protein